MHLHDLFRVSYKNLSRNKLQTGLSLLGIVIGVFSVTLIISLGLGIRQAIVGYVEGTVGRNMIAINPGVPGASESNSMVSLMMGTGPASLDEGDLRALADRRNVPDAQVAVGAVIGQDYVRAGSKDHRTQLLGVTYDYPLVVPQIKIAAGRFFTDAEDQSLSNVIVLGAKAATQLFGAADPVGQRVKVKDVSLQVIGVMRTASFVGFDLDAAAILPLRTMQKRLLGSDKLMEVDVIATDESRVPQAVFDIQRVLRKRHNVSDPSKDDFIIQTSAELADRLRTITGAIAYFLAFLAAISLLVGGIGIMTIMLVTVTQRIREVGLRKAVGAKDGDIMAQFLAESVALTSIGGIIGGTLGFLVTMLAVAVIRHAGLDVPYIVSVPAFAGAAAVSAVIGVVFGLYPARKAARLDPITALRYE